MAKVILNGSSGLTAYKADGTTVEVNYTPTELTGIKPSVFTSASPFVINSGLTVDASTTPANLLYSDGTSTLLKDYSAPLITANTESFSEGDQNHVMPSGIQANDLLVMVQASSMSSGDGYAPPADVGTGFSIARPNDLQVGNWYQLSGNYDLTMSYISYKKAVGTESGTTIGGFCSSSSPYGTPRGYRRLFVFRPTYEWSTIATERIYAAASSGSASAPSHTLSDTVTGSADYATIGVILNTSTLNGVGPTLTGEVTSYDDTNTFTGSRTNAYGFFGAFSKRAPFGDVTFTGPANTTAVDGMGGLLIIPTP